MRVTDFGCLLFIMATCEGPKQPVAEEQASCKTACVNQKELGCELGKDTPEGSTCVEVCTNSNTIAELAWDVRSLTESKRCEEQQ